MDPSSLVPLAGSAPEWIGASLSVIALRRSSRVKDFLDELLAAGVTSERLVTAVEQSEILGDLLHEAANAAAECSDEQRRKLLARALVAGIEGGVELDDARFFTRTMRQVDPVHMKLLGLVSVHQPLSSQEMGRAWPDAQSMIKPMRARLNREGLIEDMSLGVTNAFASGSWGLTDYGHRFLNFVLGSGVEVEWL
jgi:hypothetical protein